MNTAPKEATLTDPIDTIENNVVDFSFDTKNGSQTWYDGWGLMGMGVHRFNSRNPFIAPRDDDDDDSQGYTSRTPFRVYRRAQDDYEGRLDEDEDEKDERLSETFTSELVFTWETDPQHARSLCTIPECDD
ncbi:hypothetical protein H0H93_015126 [Arthromyces matolae]|nr:hypothetical protein H0H93_015126 [Arthromyces matolae]